MNEIERAIYGAAYVRAFHEHNHDKPDVERSRLAAYEAMALVRLHRSSVPLSVDFEIKGPTP